MSRSLRGHCFPSPVCGRGLDVGVEGSRWPRARLEKNREWGRSAEKGLTGHLYWRCEVQQRLQHAQSYLLKIHGSARSIRSLFFLVPSLGNERRWQIEFGEMSGRELHQMAGRRPPKNADASPIIQHKRLPHWGNLACCAKTHSFHVLDSLSSFAAALLLH